MIKIQCPAKINLTLEVLGKRIDGFHNIKSIMQTINLYDILTIELEKSETFEIELSGTSDKIPYDEKNLVYKAAQLFFETLNDKNYKVKIHIEKNIPIAAGLAGGSTDAAGCLYGLNKLLAEPLNKRILHEMCSKLGSDLNFCLEGGRKLATGRGELLADLPYQELMISLIKPDDLGISAKEAYEKYSTFNQGQNEDIEFYNDLEYALVNDYEKLKFIKQNYPDSVMSGSGSTFFLVGGTFFPIAGYSVWNNLKTTYDGVKIL